MNLLLDAKNKFDLVITHWLLPDLDIAILLFHATVKEIPTIVTCSDLENATAEQKALQNGACLYIEKPISVGTVKSLRQYAKTNTSTNAQNQTDTEAVIDWEAIFGDTSGQSQTDTEAVIDWEAIFGDTSGQNQTDTEAVIDWEAIFGDTSDQNQTDTEAVIDWEAFFGDTSAQNQTDTEADIDWEAFFGDISGQNQTDTEAVTDWEAIFGDTSGQNQTDTETVIDWEAFFGDTSGQNNTDTEAVIDWGTFFGDTIGQNPTAIEAVNVLEATLGDTSGQNPTAIEAVNVLETGAYFETEEAENPKTNTCFRWTAELHQKFTTACFLLGPGNCYPEKIRQLMGVPGLTRRQVASHLQNCRDHSNEENNVRGMSGEMPNLKLPAYLKISRQDQGGHGI